MRVNEPGTIPYNDEPATDPTHEKKIGFESCGQRFEITIQVPLYIWNALGSEDWDFAEQQIRERAGNIRLEAARAGMIGHWREKLNEFAKTAVYNQFMKRQQRVGNFEGHAAPQGW